MTGKERRLPVIFLRRLPPGPPLSRPVITGNKNEILQKNKSESLVKMMLVHRYVSTPNTPRKKI